MRIGSARFERERQTAFGSMRFAADCQDRYGLERQAEKWFLRIGTVRRTKTVRTDEYRCETDDDTMPERT